MNSTLLCPGAAYNQRWHKIKFSQNSILGGAYGSQKCRIPKFVLDPLQMSTFWEALGSKKYQEKSAIMIQRGNFQRDENFKNEIREEYDYFSI